MTAAWLKGYLPGSFKGVPFLSNRGTTSGGRRHADHIYPGRDDIDHEDLGRKDQIFNFSAYLVADDYFSSREALIEALNSEGPGTLVHPYRGTFQVVCKTFTQSETTNEGRMTRFDLAFALQTTDSLTKVSPNTQGLALAAKTSLLDAAKAWLEKVYNIVSAPVRAIEDVNDTLNDALDVVEGAKKIANTQAEFKRALRDMRGKGIALALNAAIIFDDFKNIIDFGSSPGPSLGLAATAENAERQIREQYEITPFVDVIVGNTPSSILKDPDYPSQQVQQVITYIAIGSVVGLITEVSYTSVEEAEDGRDTLFDLINTESERVSIDDTIYEALRDCKAAIEEDLSQRAITLPRIAEVIFPETRNSLFATNELYGNIDEEQDLIKRNFVIHPGFIPGVIPIKVKTNA